MSIYASPIEVPMKLIEKKVKSYFKSITKFAEETTILYMAELNLVRTAYGLHEGAPETDVMGAAKMNKVDKRIMYLKEESDNYRYNHDKLSKLFVKSIGNWRYESVNRKQELTKFYLENREMVDYAWKINLETEVKKRGEQVG